MLRGSSITIGGGGSRDKDRALLRPYNSVMYQQQTVSEVYTNSRRYPATEKQASHHKKIEINTLKI